MIERHPLLVGFVATLLLLADDPLDKMTGSPLAGILAVFAGSAMIGMLTFTLTELRGNRLSREETIKMHEMMNACLDEARREHLAARTLYEASATMPRADA